MLFSTSATNSSTSSCFYFTAASAAVVDIRHSFVIRYVCRFSTFSKMTVHLLYYFYYYKNMYKCVHHGEHHHHPLTRSLTRSCRLTLSSKDKNLGVLTQSTLRAIVVRLRQDTDHHSVFGEFNSIQFHSIGLDWIKYSWRKIKWGRRQWDQIGDGGQIERILTKGFVLSNTNKQPWRSCHIMCSLVRQDDRRRCCVPFLAKNVIP